MKRYNIISAMRILACLLVVRGHYLDLFVVPSFLSKGIITGAGPVVVFFVISGFLACESYSKSTDAVNYYKKRAMRIIPGYYITLILCIFVEYFWGLGIGMKLGIGGWLRYFTFTNMIIPSFRFSVYNNLFGFWTMGCFPFCYLLVPLLYKWMNKKKGIYTMMVLSISLNVITRIIVQFIFQKFGFSESSNFGNLSPFSTLYLFIFGMAVAYAKNCKNEIGISFFLGCVFFVMLALGKSGYVFWGVASALICLIPTVDTPNSSRFKRIGAIWKHICNYIDNNSFNIYLVHILVATTVIQICGLNGMKECFYSIVLSFLIAGLIGYISNKIVNAMLRTTLLVKSSLKG